jgi:uncharacterized protein (TIGR02117 family)
VAVKFLKRLCAVVIVIALIVAAGTLLPRSASVSQSVETAGHANLVLVLSNPIHTDIALPVREDVLARFGFLREGNLDIDNPGVRYIVFGWGGRAFYTQTPTWADLKPLPLFKGVTLDRSVMHVSIAGDIPLSHSDVTALSLSDAGYENLVAFILGSFAMEKGKQMPLVGTSYGEYDAFFEGVGYFTAVMGCNTWTAAALRNAGVTTGWWTPLPKLLSASLRLHNDKALFVDGTAPSGP